MRSTYMWLKPNSVELVGFSDWTEITSAPRSIEAIAQCTIYKQAPRIPANMFWARHTAEEKDENVLKVSTFVAISVCAHAHSPWYMSV